VIGNRLHRASDRYDEIHSSIDCNLNQDCSYWAKEFLSKCSTRKKNDEEYYENGDKRHTDSLYPVKVNLTHFECWSLGNRLFEIGKWFDKKGHERIASETKWLARRFHAEANEA
jgi:hypothetical protein